MGGGVGMGILDSNGKILRSYLASWVSFWPLALFPLPSNHVITLGSFSVYLQEIHVGLFQWSPYIPGWSLKPPQQKKFKINKTALHDYLILSRNPQPDQESENRKAESNFRGFSLKNRMTLICQPPQIPHDNYRK